ncbi:MAG: type II CAAX endopeptidase family protein [Chloroflexota bacterium]
MNLAQPTMTQEPFWRWRDVCVLIATAIILITAANMLTVALFMRDGTPRDELAIPWSVNFGLLAVQVIVMLGSVYAILRWRGLDFSVLKLHWPQRCWIKSAVVFAVVLRIWMVPITALLGVLGFPMENPQIAFFAPEGMTVLAAIGMLLMGGIAIPIAEEVFFRGVIYTWLRQWGKTMALIVSSLLFAIAHLHPTIVVSTFLVGLIAGMLYERSQSLWTSILVHCLFNITGILLIYVYLALGIDLSGQDVSALIAPMLGIAR